MKWSALAERAPLLADLGRHRLEEPGVVLVGTIRRDGTARISPVEPLLWDGDLGEYKVRGNAVEAHSDSVQDGYAEQGRSRLGWEPTPGRFHLFRVDIHDVTFIRYDDATGDQFVTRWPSGQEFVRRGDGGTCLHDPEPYRALLTGR